MNPLADGLPHLPVLLDEVIAALAPRDGGIYLDGTFGAGGYSHALLAAARCQVIGIDRDPTAIRYGDILRGDFPDRLTMIAGRFGDMAQLVEPLGIATVAGVTLDLGVSSMQINTAERGFSFRQDGPLDMRMGQDGPSAADLVNSLPEAQLADIIHEYGEERFARRVARAIIAARSRAPLTRTADLAAVVRNAVPTSPNTIDPATRTFQALRIEVNDELGEIDRGLLAAERLLEPGGRLAVVSFHSLEDRRVKNFLRARSGAAPHASRHVPTQRSRLPSFRLLSRKATVPSAAEIARNPRARSAHLRAAERTTAPAWGITP